MTNIHIHDLIDQLHIPINHLSIDGKIVIIGSVGTCVVNGNVIIECSLNWTKIFEQNKVKLVQMINDMYGFTDDELDITPKPDRVLELKFKGKEMTLTSVRYNYNSSDEWTLERTTFRNAD